MATASQIVPRVTVTGLPAGDAFAATGIDDVVVFVGPASKGSLNTPTAIASQDIATLTATFGNGPTVKRAARALSWVAQPIVFVRCATATVAATKSSASVSRNVSSDFTYTLSGTPTDGADIVVHFVAAAVTTGTSGITYKVSYDGGATYGSTTPLGTATSITVLGVSVALGSGKVVTPADEILWWQMPASSTVLPTSQTGTGTSVLSVSGTPVDAYDFALEVITGGTIGTAGIVFRYCLDSGAASPSWVTVSLGTATTFTIIDGPLSTESTGLTLAFAAGTLVAGDAFTFGTTSPAYDSAGITAALSALKAWDGTWTWVRAVGPVSAALAATVSGIIGAWDAANLPSWGVVDARDRGTYETLAAWSARVDADFDSYTSVYVGYSKGYARMSEPINGRSNRHPAFDAITPRAMSLPIQVDWGEYDIGQLPPDVTITDAGNTVVEYDASSDPTGLQMGAICLRRWPREAGVFPAGACLPGPTGDINRIPLRRVKCVADRQLARSLKRDVLKGLRVIPAGTPDQTLAGYPKLKAGRDLEASDVARINRVINADLRAAVGPETGRSNGVAYQVSPTPVQFGGGAIGLTGKLKINGLEYVVAVDATSQFVK